MREILQSVLDARGITTYKLEKMSGVPQPTTSRFLSGKHGEPKGDTVKRWAESLGLTESQLRGLEPIDNDKEGASPRSTLPAPESNVGQSVDILRSIRTMQGDISPRSREILLKLEQKTLEGKLDDNDWELLERIANRLEKDQP